MVQVEHREHGGDGSIADYRSQSDLSEEQQYKAFELRHMKLQESGGLLSQLYAGREREEQ